MRDSMMEAGASAYISKSEGAQALVETIRKCFSSDVDRGVGQLPTERRAIAL